MIYNFFDKKSSGGIVKNEIMYNKELAKELQTNYQKISEKKSTLIFYTQYLGC